jgi:hypothetical protein
MVTPMTNWNSANAKWKLAEKSPSASGVAPNSA